MKAEEAVRSILAKEFFNLQSKNPNYSMRAYSKKVGIPQSAISEIIGRKRRITEKMASKVLSGLAISPDRAAEIMDSYHAPRSIDPVYEQLDIDQFHVIAEWYHFAILSLAETKGFKSDPQWIGARLGVPESAINIAIERLLRLGLIRRNLKTKKLVATGAQYSIDPGVATLALKKACRENLELASDALESTEFVERDFTAITICFDPKKMATAKKLIKEFRGRFAHEMESGSKNEVYKLSVQLFPLTKNGVSS